MLHEAGALCRVRQCDIARRLAVRLDCRQHAGRMNRRIGIMETGNGYAQPTHVSRRDRACARGRRAAVVRAGRRHGGGEEGRQGGLVLLGAGRDRAEDRQSVSGQDRHQCRAVPLGRFQHPAAVPAGGRQRQGVRRRADALRSGRRQCADQEGLVRSVQGDRLRQGAGRGQGCAGHACRAAAQRDGDLRARRHARRGRSAEDLDRPPEPEIQGQDRDARSQLLVAAGRHRRDVGEGPRLAILREAARQRRHGGAEQPAGLRHDQARRACDRDGGGRRLCRAVAQAGHEDLDPLSEPTGRL